MLFINKDLKLYIETINSLGKCWEKKKLGLFFHKLTFNCNQWRPLERMQVSGSSELWRIFGFNLTETRAWWRLVNHKVATPPNMPDFIIYFTINGTIIHSTNLIMDWRRLKAIDWDHKLIKEPTTEEINQMRSRVIFSWAYIQSEVFCNRWNRPLLAIKALLRPRSSVHILYSKYYFFLALQDAGTLN